MLSQPSPVLNNILLPITVQKEKRMEKKISINPSDYLLKVKQTKNAYNSMTVKLKIMRPNMSKGPLSQTDLLLPLTLWGMITSSPKA